MSTTKPGRMQKMILVLFFIHPEHQVSFIYLNNPRPLLSNQFISGTPKPVIYTNLMMTSVNVSQSLPDADDRTSMSCFIGRRVYSTIPMYHVSHNLHCFFVIKMRTNCRGSLLVWLLFSSLPSGLEQCLFWARLTNRLQLQLLIKCSSSEKSLALPRHQSSSGPSAGRQRRLNV